LIKNIIFDFDGVILDSIPVKTEAFRKLFEKFPKEKVSELIEFHIENGGMSRYKKIEYFFTIILNREINEIEVLKYAKKYSKITKEELTQSKYLIKDCINFIKQNYQNYNLHIASGADEQDLLYICKELDLTQYFLSIHGSPVVKNEIVAKILLENKYKKIETRLIGDSINDYEAANANEIEFYGYNNKKLEKRHKYISMFKGWQKYEI